MRDQAGQTAIVDEAAVERLKGFGGVKLVRGMVELFVQNAPVRASEAREAFDCGDAAALRAALHALKSSAGQLGASSVYAACIAGEELASRGELGPCAMHLQRIETDLPLVCEHLEHIRADSVA
ncbi:MAG TPA: Hpt domain-containing protein [Gemmatimonadaceae bacterium]|nr:Hpt domain-containing protein [Gemmatimonadaceae bacterium]